MSQDMKDMARELDVPVVVLSQLSRAWRSRSDSRPQLSDLRDSGSLEQDADVVLFPWRPAYAEGNVSKDTPEHAQIIIAKNRNGPCLSVDVTWDPVRMAFLDTETGPDVPATPDPLDEIVED
jgi:replicative DNA helicase